MLSDLMQNAMLGLETALQPSHLGYCILGVFLGQLLGAIPGIGTLVAITLLFPVTYYLSVTESMIMLAGIYYGTAYGGSTASILLNLPGTPSNAVACLDGYPMAQQGRAGVALSMTTLGSFVGGSIGILLTMLFAPMIAEGALLFGPWEYVALMSMGLIAASTLGGDSVLKGIAMVLVGITIGTVGLDIYSGTPRFTLGVIGLLDGVSLVALAMGVFGVAEVISKLSEDDKTPIETFKVTLRSMIPTRDDLVRSWPPILRASFLGSFFGALPGTGGFIASFASYAVEKKLADDPSRFGKGAIEGLVGPETANNAADQTNFIPTLTLGIPGSATMAIMLGVLIMNGITPGPSVVVQEPALFWGLIMSFWVGNVVLVILNIPMIGLWTRLLTIPYNLLYPVVLVFVCVGLFSAEGSAFGIYVVIIFGIFGYVSRILDLPLAPMVLGFVLGPLMEENFRRALVVSRGDLTTFLQRPLSLSLLICALLILVVPLITSSLRRRRQRLAA